MIDDLKLAIEKTTFFADDVKIWTTDSLVKALEEAINLVLTNLEI